MWRRFLVSRLPHGGRCHALELLFEQLNFRRQPVQLLLLLVNHLVQLLDPDEIERGGWFDPVELTRWLQERPQDFASAFRVIWARCSTEGQGQ